VANNKVYVGYPIDAGATDLQVVDLSDYSVKKLDIGFPTGVAVISLKKAYLPLVIKDVP
jgi:hypothetical protein